MVLILIKIVIAAEFTFYDELILVVLLRHSNGFIDMKEAKNEQNSAQKDNATGIKYRTPTYTANLMNNRLEDLIKGLYTKIDNIKPNSITTINNINGNNNIIGNNNVIDNVTQFLKDHPINGKSVTEYVKDYKKYTVDKNIKYKKSDLEEKILNEGYEKVRKFDEDGSRKNYWSKK
jgi:hypothetical protein